MAACNWPLLYLSDTLLSIFNEAAAGVTSGESALWDGEMKAAERRGDREREEERERDKHPTVSFHCPL